MTPVPVEKWKENLTELHKTVKEVSTSYWKNQLTNKELSLW